MSLTVSADERQELLVTYAALILNDDKVAITADNIGKLISAAGGKVEPYWPKLFAQLLDGKDVDELLLNVGAAGPSAGGAAPAAGGDAPAAEAAAAAEPEEESESEEDMGFSLFD